MRAPGVGRREGDVERARLAALVEHSGEAIVAVDRELCVTAFNPAAEWLFARAAEDTIGAPLSELLAPADGGPGARIERALQGETLRFDTAPGDGRLRVEVTVAPIRDPEGEVIGAVSLARDVTLERAARAELERDERRSRFAARAGDLLATSLDRPSTVEALNRLALGELADLSAVFTFADGGSELLLEHIAVADRAVEAALRSAGQTPMRLRPEGLIARVVATDQPVLAETVPAELDLMWHEVYPTLAEELAPLTAYSAMVVPLRAVDGMAGALFLVSLQATRRYDADDLRIAVELADRVGQTLERVRLYEAALVARDAAEASERRLRAARERFTAAFEHAPVGMALIEPAGPSGPTLVEVNTALCDLSGYAYDELIGRDPVDVLLHPDERPQVRAALAGLAPGGTTTYRAERRWVNRAGETLWVQVHVALIGGPNGPQVVFQAQDVTERHRVEETQRRINEELERRVAARTAEVRSVNRELEAANRELEAFSYSAAHDLRAPLRAIDGFAAALAAEQAGALPPGALHYVELVRQGAREMSALIDDLLAFSRVGLQAMHVERVEPRALVVAAVQDLADQRAGRAVEIAVGDLPPLAADPRLLALVYRNLLANSLKFTRGRTPARIEVGFDPAVAGGVYYVRDNGIGFDAADAEQIFNVFRRLHPAEAYEGTGVGLALVKRIVERHGGAIWAESEDGVGATFYFRLDPPASEPAEPVTGAARGSAEPRSGRR